MPVDPDVPELPPIPISVHMHDPETNTAQVVEMEIFPEEDFDGFEWTFPWHEEDGTVREIPLRFDWAVSREMAFDTRLIDHRETLPSRG